MGPNRPDFQTPSLLDQFLAALRQSGSRASAWCGAVPEQLSKQLARMAPDRRSDPALRSPERRTDTGGPVITAAVAAALLFSIPLSTAIGAHMLATANEHQSHAIESRHSTRLAVVREAERIERMRPAIARLLGRRTVSELVERLARVLPREARIHALSREADGAIVAEIEIIDPDLLRRALASDPLLASLRASAQQVVPDGGIRVTLRSEQL